MISRFFKSDATIPGEHVVRRIQWLTIAFGIVSAVAALALHRLDWAKGLFGGALLGWLNFRWLQSGIRGIFETALSQANASVERGEAPASGANSATSGMFRAFAMLFRYAFVALGVYVIFMYLHVPLISIGLGLCALVGAIIAASVWEAVKPVT
jgi:hypothetical protein